MLKALVRGELPPVGGRVTLGRSSLPEFPGYEPVWVDSGTSALALALLCAKRGADHIDAPEVVLPGYGCPDLVAAALYAGLRPVLADLSPDDCGYDLGSLQQSITANTVAVVAVNFLGIRERLEEIQALIAHQPYIALVEDNAQWFPEDDFPLVGDYVCLSFGRGKPVSLLGGGLLLLRSGPSRLSPEAVAAWTGRGELPGGISYRLKTLLYNTLLQRNLYALATRNPWVQVGRTTFEPLVEIAAIGPRSHFVGANTGRHLARSRHLEAEVAELVQRSPHVAVDLPSASQRSGRLLRYPILCRSSEERDALLASGQGLGITAMYKTVLPDIEGVAARLERSASLANANAFARRLLTLPVHESVQPGDVARLAKWLAAVR